jgi:hypothetical protein
VTDLTGATPDRKLRNHRHSPRHPGDRPSRALAKQLAGHWARKGSAAKEDGATVIRFDTGQVVHLWPSPGVLHVEITVPDGGDADRFAEVVKDHLERFGQREELDLVWDGR